MVNKYYEEHKDKFRKSQQKTYATHKGEYRARTAVQLAIKTGKLQRQPCEICGCEKTEAHHDDYNRPLDVRWLCVNHHKEWHTKNSPIRPHTDDREIKCKWCGRIFRPKERHSLYCSQGCKLEGRRSVNRKSWHNNSWKYKSDREQIKCPECGKLFIPHSTQKYCSQECFNEARKRQKREAYHRIKKNGTEEVYINGGK